MIEHRITIPAITHAPGPSGNRWVVSGSQDGSIGVWDVQRRKKGGSMDGSSSVVQVNPIAVMNIFHASHLMDFRFPR